MTTLSLVGAVGGAGTTRTTLESAAVLARTGRDVCVLDAAYATQGLADHVSGRLDTDVTALCTDADAGTPSLAAGLVDVETDDAGRLAVCPARAPFERLARAKTPEAAQRFGSLVETAADSFDHVLVDVPPVAANQAVAAVTTTDRVALVAPDTPRGHDGLARQRDRLADVGAPDPETVLTFTDGGDPEDVAGAIPEADTTDPREVPVSLTADDSFVAGVARTCETLFGASFDLDTDEPGVLDRIGR
ncbi:ParA family protein [Halomarina oriensis]|uniref:ParA family protein n=1 Tax=Halomarina oriensis TaxID=671145 RepID=A0A6B0GIY7_9EURY|nr:ParA family protein [Halomarina oriensis]MWG34600.1 ParA family protein [Halomarina oriensis]